MKNKYEITKANIGKSKISKGDGKIRNRSVTEVIMQIQK